jgi:hypothetical protein
MLQATCPKLRAIAGLLREKYDAHFALIARDAQAGELRRAEAEVFRTNRLMTNHRRKCPHCTPAATPETSIRTRPPLLEMVS